MPEYVVPPWSGRRVRRLVNATLAWKGRTCHLCGEPGANSADHDPPRSVLLARGVPNPDDVGLYLWPAHKVCNLRRQKRPVTPELKAELRRRFLREPTPSPDAARSSRFARFFDSTDPSGRGRAFLSITGGPGEISDKSINRQIDYRKGAAR